MRTNQMRCRICKRQFNPRANTTYEDSEQWHFKCPHCGHGYARDEFEQRPEDEEMDWMIAQSRDETIAQGFQLLFTPKKQHLWEIEHPYYAAEGELCDEKSWADFVADMGDADDDMNLLYRWDWEGYFDPEECREKVTRKNLPTDPNYRWGQLKLTFILQRKSKFITHVVDVCPADEPAIQQYLAQKWAYLKKNWEGISEG